MSLQRQMTEHLETCRTEDLNKFKPSFAFMSNKNREISTERCLTREASQNGHIMTPTKSYTQPNLGNLLTSTHFNKSIKISRNQASKPHLRENLSMKTLFDT